MIDRDDERGLRALQVAQVPVLVVTVDVEDVIQEPPLALNDRVAVGRLEACKNALHVRHDWPPAARMAFVRPPTPPCPP